MPQLIVRNLDEEVVRCLKKRAGEHGVSAEEEHRRILREALLGRETKPSLWAHLGSLPDPGDEAFFARDRSVADRATPQRLFEEE